MRARLLLIAVIAAIGLAVVVQSFAAGAGPEGVSRFGHVFVIVGENTDYQHLTPTSAPYLMTTIRPTSAWFANYYAATHWSQANYVALTSGQFTACEQADRGYACRDGVDNLFHQLDVAQMNWKVWLESGTARCDTGSGSNCASNDPCPLAGFYTSGNPPINYTNISYDECLANDVPAGTADDGMASFNANLATGNVADFNLVIPNGCDDGERNCKPVNDRYRQFDDFLAREVPLIEASPAFGRNGVIVVTYDEDQRMGGLAAKNDLGSGGHIMCALLSPLVRPGEYGSKTYSYSVLRTLQDGFGLTPYLGAAAQVSPLPVSWK
jgi:hypothetical protein